MYSTFVAAVSLTQKLVCWLRPCIIVFFEIQNKLIGSCYKKFFEDYHPFGMIMPGRVYAVGSAYRYGFNGKEQDSAINGTGVDYDYGFRIYDARVGRFLSVDPLTKKYAFYTPYQFTGNKPIVAIDIDGKEDSIIINWYDKAGEMTRTKIIAPNYNQVLTTLYRSLSAGLNTTTTYDIEGVKFNSTNAQFTQGADAYKKAANITFSAPTADLQHPGVLIHPEHINAPTAGTLIINSYANGTVNLSFNYQLPTAKQQWADFLHSWSTVGGATGNVMQGAGFICAVCGVPEAGVPLMAWGKGVSLSGTTADVGADVLNGNYKSAGIKAASAAGSEVIGAAILTPVGKIADKSTKQAFNYLSDKAADNMVGQAKKALLPEQETSTDLNYNITPAPK